MYNLALVEQKERRWIHRDFAVMIWVHGNPYLSWTRCQKHQRSTVIVKIMFKTAGKLIFIDSDDRLQNPRTHRIFVNWQAVATDSSTLIWFNCDKTLIKIVHVLFTRVTLKALSNSHVLFYARLKQITNIIQCDSGLNILRRPPCVQGAAGLVGFSTECVRAGVCRTIVRPGPPHRRPAVRSPPTRCNYFCMRAA